MEEKKYEFSMRPVAELFYSDESAYGVYIFYTDDIIPHTEQSKQISYDDDVFGLTDGGIVEFVNKSRLVGKMQKLDIGSSYTIVASPSYSKKYKGWNYNVISIKNNAPKTKLDQQKYLESILTRLQTKSLMDAYPNIVVDVINGNVDGIDLNKTPGIKEKTWNRIKDKIESTYVMSEILSLLSPLGVSMSKIRTIFNGEKNTAILKQRLLDDPYFLADMPGITFRKADEIALKLNPSLKVSRERASAFIKGYFKKIGSESGHTWTNIDSLSNEVRDNIFSCYELYEEIIAGQRELNTFLHIDGDKIGMASYFNVEKSIYDIINKISVSKPIELAEEEFSDGVGVAEKEQEFEFTKEQRECLISIGNSNFNIITGRAGSGKSTLLRGVIKIYNKKFRVATCALSAKAAKRIEETTGVPSQTIHRLLGAKGLNEFSYNEKIRLPYDVIVIDECSMVNASLLNRLLVAIKDGAKVILCGDARQLPSMGYGNIFYDVLENEELQINYLTKIMRQAAESGIITDANKIRDNIEVFSSSQKPSNATNGNLNDMHYKFRDNRKRLNSIAIKRYISSVEKVGIDNVFIIVPRKNNCINSTSEINRQIQDILLEDESRYIEYGKKIFKVGSKVIHTKNNYEKNIFNGEIGYVKDVVYKGDSASEITVEYPDKIIEYMKSELKELDHAYALTVHKFQGSEAHTIIIVIDNSHYMLLSTELLYTAITRASKRCLLLAEPYAWNTSVKNNKGTNRQTWMKDFIENKERYEEEK